MFALKLSAAGAFSAVLSCAAMAAGTPVRQSSLDLYDHARHNDMFDGGSEELKARILAEIEKFLQKQGGSNGA
ncbi:hypothetical protein RBA41_01000 [Massilia sp. CCM 9210]|uniref:hypothetical protein n=1 Tax=Massilia scottii TaxID=3057166 RepID=UPI0027967F9D|nr:hypothetical protein [Massilia sp. CCM 9210]MDQ1811871.1 hypothetical protein [Massilia sp. CCM 9210]